MNIPPFLALALVFLSMSLVFLLKTYADTRFLSVLGADLLPHMLVTQALAMIGLSLGYSVLVRQIQSIRLDLALILITGVCVLAGPLLIEGSRSAAFTACLLLLSMPAAANLALWNSAASVVGGRGFRRLLPRLGASATAGGVVGSFLASSLAGKAGIGLLIPVAAGFILALGAVRWWLERLSPQTYDGISNNGFEASDRQGMPHQRLLIFLVFAVLLENMLSGLADFGFKRALSEHLDANELGVFLALFYAALNGGLLLFQWFSASRLFSYRPLRQTALIAPVLLLLNGLLWMLFPILWAAVWTRFADGILRFALARPCLDIVLTTLSALERYRWKVLLQGGFAQLGTVLAGLALISTSPWIGHYFFLLPGLLVVLAALWLLVEKRVVQAYLDALGSRLGRRRLLYNRDAEILRLDREGLARIVGLLQERDPKIPVFARRLLNQLDIIATDLVPHLAGTLPQVREILYRLIWENPDPRSRKALQRAVAREWPAFPRLWGIGLMALAAHRDAAEIPRAQSLFRQPGEREVDEKTLLATLYITLLDAGKGAVFPLEQLLRHPLGYDPALVRFFCRTLVGRDHRGRRVLEQALFHLLDTARADERQRLLPFLGMVGSAESVRRLLAGIQRGYKGAVLAVAELDAVGLRHLCLQIREAEISDSCRSQVLYAMRLNRQPEAVDCVAGFLLGHDLNLRRIALNTLVKKTKEGYPLASRNVVARAIMMELDRFAIYTAARKPLADRMINPLLESELDKRTEECLLDLCGLLALRADPASIYTAYRGLQAPDRDIQRQALDVFQELGPKCISRKRLIYTLEHYLLPPAGTLDMLKKAIALDPWLAECASGNLAPWAARIMALRRSEMFQDLEGPILLRLARHASELCPAKGTAILRKGDEGDAMYVVLQGEVEVIDSKAMRKCLKMGSAFGELALLDGQRRSATVLTGKDTQLLRLERSAFLDILATHPQLGIGVLRVLAKWLRNQAESG